MAKLRDQEIRSIETKGHHMNEDDLERLRILRLEQEFQRRLQEEEASQQEEDEVSMILRELADLKKSLF